MNQLKYIFQAILFLFAGIITYLIIQKFAGTKIVADAPTVIDYNMPESTPEAYVDGKNLFTKNCASCHSIFKTLVGPPLANFEDRGPWRDRKKLYQWIHNSSSFMIHDSYTRDLKIKFGGTQMTHFPDLSEKDIDAIADYINISHLSYSAPVSMK